MERRRNQPPSRSSAPSYSAGSSSSTSRRTYSNRNGNSDYKNSKYTSSNRSFGDGFEWRSRRSSDGKSHVQKLESKEEGVAHDLPPVLVGTCPFMCPGAERAQRERLRDLAIFERLHGNPGKTSPGLAVKKAAIYFNKIQCFCFEEQRLLPGEQIDMPVFFYIDPEFETDPKMDGINNLILSYTFFKVSEE